MGDWIDKYLWGDGYYERERAYWPEHPFDRIPRGPRCAGCGRPILPGDESAVFEGLAFHDRCFGAKFLHPEQEP